MNKEEKLDRDEAKKDMKMYLALDYDLVGEYPEYFKLRKNTASMTGHILVFIFLGWWTLGLANLVYWLLSFKTKKIIK